MIKMRLNWNEVNGAAMAGIARFIIPIKQGQRNRYQAINDWTNDINGCIAEMIVAKYTGQYWHSSPAIDSPSITSDVGARIEVRTSRTNKLVVRSGDHDDRIYVLVTWPEFDQNGCFATIAGGMVGADAKQDCYKEDFGKNRPFCFAIPQSDLTPFSELANYESKRIRVAEPVA